MSSCRSERKVPPLPASEFKEGTRKKGLDNTMYVVVKSESGRLRWAKPCTLAKRKASPCKPRPKTPKKPAKKLEVCGINVDCDSSSSDESDEDSDSSDDESDDDSDDDVCTKPCLLPKIGCSDEEESSLPAKEVVLTTQQRPVQLPAGRYWIGTHSDNIVKWLKSAVKFSDIKKPVTLITADDKPAIVYLHLWRCDEDITSNLRVDFAADKRGALCVIAEKYTNSRVDAKGWVIIDRPITITWLARTNRDHPLVTLQYGADAITLE